MEYYLIIIILLPIQLTTTIRTMVPTGINAFKHLKIAKTVLLSLLAIDIVFFIIHSLTELNVLPFSRNVYVQTDKGYPEIFQYVKYGIILVVILQLMIKHEQRNFVGWGFLFTLLWLDDMLQFHENAGAMISSMVGFTPKFGLKAEDFGEMVYAAIAGTFLLTLIGYCYYKGSTIFRQRNHILLFLFGCLLFFGIGVDMVHSFFRDVNKLNLLIAAVEDGGEMLVMSLMVTYFVAIYETNEEEIQNRLLLQKTIL